MLKYVRVHSDVNLDVKFCMGIYSGQNVYEFLVYEFFLLFVFVISNKKPNCVFTKALTRIEEDC